MLNKRLCWLTSCAAMVLMSGCGDDDSKSSNAFCENVKCPAGTVCSEEKGSCVKVEDMCPGVTCKENETLNPDTCACQSSIFIDLCKDIVCTANQTCHPTTGKCEPNIDQNPCNGVICGKDETLNPNTCRCESDKPVCSGVVCKDGEMLDFATCQCLGSAYGDTGCESDDDCKTDVSFPEYCDLTTKTCKNGACKGKTWNDEYQFCSVTGLVQCFENYCDNSETAHCACAEGSTCDLTTHMCVGSCEEDPDNIVINGGFEEWTNNQLLGWTLVDNAYAQGGNVQRSNKPHACKYAVTLSNTSTKNARLESDPIEAPVVSFTGGNAKYECKAYAYGEGKLNLGYRTLTGTSDNYEKLTEKTTEEVHDFIGTSSYQMLEFEVSIAQEATAFQILLGFHKTSAEDPDAAITVDDIICTPKANICTDVTCSDFETCSVKSDIKKDGAYIGQCLPNAGYCNVQTVNDKEKTYGCNTTIEKCNTETHLCERIDGKCAKHTDCETGKKCDTATNACVEGDRCENVKCAEYQMCDAQTGACVLDSTKCLKSTDCNDKDKPICDSVSHTCTTIDAVGKDGKPLNIIPNGSFENWDEVAFGTSEKYFNLPLDWFGTEYEIWPTHLVTEFDANNVKPYTTDVRSGKTALQLIYTKSTAKRFSSEGFNVPAGTYDCSYFVRGKGDIRIHSFSSRGEHAKSEFTSIDSETWTRIPFSIKDMATDMRLVFYVGKTDAAKDHIQIDDVVCVPWQY